MCAGRRHAGGGGIGDDHDAASGDLNLTRGAEDILASDEGQGIRACGNREGVLPWDNKSSEVRCAGKD